MLRLSRPLRAGGHSRAAPGAPAAGPRLSQWHSPRLPSSSPINLFLPVASSRSYATAASSTSTIPPNHIFKPHPTLRDPSSGQLLARVSGPTDRPLSELSLSQFWDELVQEHAERPALICRHEPPNLHHVGAGRSSTSAEAVASDSSCLRWSYADMDAHITSLAQGLQKLGVGPGSVVAVLMMNNSAYGALQWATAKLGAILVTLNPSYSTRELGQALNQVKASTLVLVPGLRSSDYLAALNGLLPSLASSVGKGGEVQDENFPLLKRLVLVDNLTQRPKRWEGTSLHTKAGMTFARALEKLNGKALDYRDVLAEGQAAQGISLPQVDPHQVINLQLTSGTTGRPKAVALTSRNLLNNGIAIGDNLKITPEDILCNIPPLFHCFGLTLGNMAVWSHGGAVVYSAEGFDPVRALRAVSEEGCTVIHGVPAHFIAELEVLDDMALYAKEQQKNSSGSGSGAHKVRLPPGVEPGEKFDLSSLRTGLTSGSTVPIELMHKIMHTLGSKEQTVVYGMTETSPVSFGCDLDAPVERRCETVGRIYPHCHAKIVDTDDPEGKALPVGQPGELCTGGYIVMQGYWKDEAKTKEALQQHADEPELTWMRTGDMAIMDEEGYVRIVGRSKDVIIRGGENLFPVMIENCIDELPGVTQSAAIAVPDERMGEAVGVFIGRAHGTEGSALTAQQIRQYVKDHLSPQSAPEWVFWLGEDGVADDMPKTASGKVKKVDLRGWAKELASQGKGRVKG